MLWDFIPAGCSTSLCVDINDWVSYIIQIWFLCRVYSEVALHVVLVSGVQQQKHDKIVSCSVYNRVAKQRKAHESAPRKDRAAIRQAFKISKIRAGLDDNASRWSHLLLHRSRYLANVQRADRTAQTQTSTHRTRMTDFLQQTTSQVYQSILVRSCIFTALLIPFL